MSQPDWRIEHHASLDSTQDELRRRLAADEPVAGLVLRADVQLAGRGQRVRDWRSEAGGSWQSVALKGAALPASPLFMALGIAGAVNSTLGQPCLQLKWPNDLLQDGLKVGGILCELTRGYLLVGVGVNVENEPPPGAGRLQGLELAAVHRLVLTGIWAGWQQMSERPHELQQDWAQLDALAGRRLELDWAGQRLSGTASGVDATGRLRLLTAEGEQLLDSAAGLRSSVSW